MKIKSRKSLLFFGELPPTVFHGISLSNQRILSTLAKDFVIYRVKDNSGFGSALKVIYVFVISIIRLVYLSCKQIDIYYVNAPMSYLGLMKVYLSILAVKLLSPRVRVISHLHRGDFLVFIQNIRNKKLFERFASQLTSLLVLSPSAGNELSRSDLIDNDKVVTLYNTVSVATIKEENSTSKSDTDCERSFYCLCNYIPSKRIHRLVEAVNQIPLSIVNFNGTSSSYEYMRRLKKLDINSVCRFDGVISGEDKEAKLRSAKALVLPSLNEGMPLVILESLAQGTPVICFDIGYIKDYLGEDYPGLVKELTDNALKDKINWINQLSDDEYLMLRKCSFKLFWGNYSPEIINKATSEIFNNL